MKTDIWKLRESDLSLLKRLLIRPLKILILTFRGLARDRVHLRASALTYYSLLAIVPVFAMVFGVAKGFGFENTLETLLFGKLEGQEQIAIQIVGFSKALLENVKGSLVAGIGFIILFYSIIKILVHIENAFNDIWGIEKSRSMARRIAGYFSLMLIGPFLFIMSSTLTVFITSGARFVVEKVWLFEAVGPVIFFMLKLLPFCVLWILFTFLYSLMPNIKVNFKSALLAGIIAGSVYELFQRGYIAFQMGVSNHNAIYGSFAALPLFFIWLQLGWIIILSGAEISFAHQNLDFFAFEKDCRNASHSFKRLLSLRIVHFLINRFSETKGAWNAIEISRALEIPIRLVHQILQVLVKSGIISEVKQGEDDEVAYQPARDPDTITIKSVIDAIENHGSDTIPVARSEPFKKLSDSLKVFNDLMEKSDANRRLKEI